MRQSLLIIIYVLLVAQGFGQSGFPVNGMFDDKPEVYAFTGATVHVDAETTINDATLVIKKGLIVAVGANMAIPEGAIVHDLAGKHIYPSFIDLYTEYGLKPLAKKNDPYQGPQMETDKKGAYGWNQAIKPETQAVQLFAVNKDKAGKYRSAGFGAVLTHQNDGIARGTGAFVTLGEGPEQELIIDAEAAAYYSLDKGVSSQDYPGSLMGVIALMRQTYLDAQWYASQPSKETHNISLEYWNKLQQLPQIMDAGNVLNVLRADKVGDEFGKQYIIKGSGTEYQKLDAVKATGAPLIIPVNFPKPFDVEDPYDAQNVSFAEMKHWELAPANAAFLHQAGIPFCFTTDGLEDPTKLLEAVRKAIKYGLPEASGLKALTTTPASLIGADNVTGTISKDKLANFIVTNGPLFDDKTIIEENWIKGTRFEIENLGVDVSGKYSLTLATKSYYMEVDGAAKKAKVKVKPTEQDSTELKADLTIQGKLVTLTFTEDDSLIRLSGLIVSADTWSGRAQLANGTWVNWQATKSGEKAAEEAKQDSTEKDTVLPSLADVVYPFTAYGTPQQAKQQTVLIKNATVWTNTEAGILENTDVVISGGKISAIGQNIALKTADRVIDAAGKHLTAGIVDEHSHIAISAGVNEYTQASSAEVSIADVINSEDINIYRQLAGGVTTIQLLHGSANPIGGQSAIIKLRWGFTPEEMKFKEAPKFIKFALGENVKQSNWGDYNTVRYPQTRMGVEQVFVNYFTRAKEYQLAMDNYRTLGKKTKTGILAPRRDLEMEALVEILNKERFITCHSYVQSEINMLMHVADQFDFTVNTFTHILEGYKVADKLKAHGANASTFSDWWAYKYEVIDAIAYNAAIMHEVGVNVGINSDDAEMGRRLNQEAAKIVKYGGVSEEEAWKMVTLNPAKMMHVDEWVGSIAEGKQADVVIWSANPLSVYAKAEQTFVDGMLLFDIKQDEEMRKTILKERSRLIEAMLVEKKGGKATQKPVKKEQKLWHCDDL